MTQRLQDKVAIARAHAGRHGEPDHLAHERAALTRLSATALPPVLALPELAGYVP